VPDVRVPLRLKLAQLEHEVFAVIFLDNRHRLVEYRELFRGTVDNTTVYPREIAKEALVRNAAVSVNVRVNQLGNFDGNSV